MKRWNAAVVAALGTFAVLACGWSSSAVSQAPEVSLLRLDCGTPRTDVIKDSRFSDSYAFSGLKLTIVYSCYLIKHGNEYLLWDAGHSLNAGALAPKTSLVDLLSQLSLKPENIKYIAVSHYHRDHVGQANSFKNSTLLIGKGDWEAVTSPKPSPLIDPKMLSHWIEDKGTLETLTSDKDVFGDGSVVMLATPGHTPGHYALLVKLAKTGNFILSGDLAHFRENYETQGVPAFNIDRARTLASMDRIKKLAANLNAKLVIQHDVRDVEMLPKFPEFAR